MHVGACTLALTREQEPDHSRNVLKTPYEKFALSCFSVGQRSNLMVQVCICEMLGDDVSVRYVGNWKLPGADGVVEFRTTWSSGYYLQDLVRRRPNLLAEQDTGFQDLI